MLLLDGLLLLFIGGFGFTGLRSGLIRESTTLLGMVLGLVVAGRFYEGLGPVFLSWFHTKGMSNLVAFAAILAATWIFVLLLGNVLRDILSSIRLGWLDHVGGAIFGIAKGLFMSELVVLILMAVPSKSLQAGLQASALGGWLVSIAPKLLGLIPPVLRYWKPQ